MTDTNDHPLLHEVFASAALNVPSALTIATNFSCEDCGYQAIGDELFMDRNGYLRCPHCISRRVTCEK